MDKFIEIFVYYGSIWQQTALENIQFSLVLGLLFFLIGSLLMSISKTGTITKLNRQLLQNKGQLAQAENKQEELLVQQKENAGKISDLQLQLDLSENNLTKQNQDYKAEISNKDRVHQELINKKNKEIEDLNTTINSKKQLVDQLQSQLDGQQQKIDQYTQLETELIKVKQQESQAQATLTTHQQQLESAEQDKKLLTQQLEEQKQFNQGFKEKLSNMESELEAMAEKLNAAELVGKEKIPDIQKTQPEELAEQPSEDIPAAIIASEEASPSISRTEVAEQDVVVEQLVEKKGMLNSVTGWFTSRNEKPEDTEVEEEIDVPVMAQVSEQNTDSSIIPDTESSEQKTPPVEVAEQEDIVVIEQPQETQGNVGGVVGWFNKLDEKLWIRKDFKTERIEEEDQAESHHFDKSEVSASETELEPTINAPVEVETTVSAAAPLHQESKNNLEQTESSFSEKMADFADKMDSYQGKFKGLFNKK